MSTFSTLQSKVKNYGPIPEREAIALMQRVADAIKAYHARSTMHLGIDPSTVLVDNDGNVSVLAEHGLCNVYYRPLEALAGVPSRFAAATDIYSMGALLYFMLTGANPPTATQLTSGEDSLNRLPTGTSPELKNVLETAMAGSMRNRYQSVDDLMAALKEQPQSMKGEFIGTVSIADPFDSTTADSLMSEEKKPLDIVDNPTTASSTHKTPATASSSTATTSTTSSTSTTTSTTKVGASAASTATRFTSTKRTGTTSTDSTSSRSDDNSRRKTDYGNWRNQDTEPKRSGRKGHKVRNTLLGILATLVVLGLIGHFSGDEEGGNPGEPAEEIESIEVTTQEPAAPAKEQDKPTKQPNTGNDKPNQPTKRPDNVDNLSMTSPTGLKFTYSGPVTYNGEKPVANGKGTGKYSTGTFTGTYVNGSREGYGTMRDRQGNLFEGQFVGDRRRSGTYHRVSGERYEGTFDKNEQPLDGKWYDNRGKLFALVQKGKEVPIHK